MNEVKKRKEFTIQKFKFNWKQWNWFLSLTKKNVQQSLAVLPGRMILFLKFSFCEKIIINFLIKKCRDGWRAGGGGGGMLKSCDSGIFVYNMYITSTISSLSDKNYVQFRRQFQIKKGKFSNQLIHFNFWKIKKKNQTNWANWEGWEGVLGGVSSGLRLAADDKWCWNTDYGFWRMLW